MRVIGGQFRGHTLRAPAGLRVRPTSDALRETLFNVLGPRLRDAWIVDACAGTGAVGIEALSRGAAGVLFIEQAAGALKALRENLSHLHIDFEERSGRSARRCAQAPATNNADATAAWLLDGEVTAMLPRASELLTGTRGQPFCDILFLDPPYSSTLVYENVLGKLGELPPLIGHQTWVIAEHGRRDQTRNAYGALGRFRRLEQGDSALSFYSSTQQRS